MPCLSDSTDSRRILVQPRHPRIIHSACYSSLQPVVVLTGQNPPPHWPPHSSLNLFDPTSSLFFFFFLLPRFLHDLVCSCSHAYLALHPARAVEHRRGLDRPLLRRLLSCWPRQTPLILSSQLLLGLLSVGPWVLIIVYDFTLYLCRSATYEIPVVGGRARGRLRPRVPSLAERPSGRPRGFSFTGSPIPMSRSESSSDSRPHTPSTPAARLRQGKPATKDG